MRHNRVNYHSYAGVAFGVLLHLNRWVIVTCATACLVAAGVGCDKYGKPSNSTSASARLLPTTQPVENNIRRGLLADLKSRRPDADSGYWLHVLNEEQYFFGPRMEIGMGLRERDSAMDTLASALEGVETPSDIRVLIIEHLYGCPWQIMRYHRMVLYTGSPSRRAVVEGLSALGALDAGSIRWPNIEKHVANLLRLGGSENGKGIVFDAEDATVVSFFDGSGWHSATWFWFTDPSDADDPLGFTPASHEFYELLRFIKSEYGSAVKYDWEAFPKGFRLQDD